MAQIFISYSRVDNHFVDNLIKRIQQAFPALDIWRDQSPHGLIGGDIWWDEILRAVAESDVFVYVLSNESVQSRYCQAEFTEARRLQKRIITIQARDKTELTDNLDDIQFIDMQNGADDADALTRLVAAINKQLGLAKARRPLWKPPTPRPQKDAPPTRTASSPTIDTPALTRPTAEVEAIRIAKNGVRWQIIGVVISVILGGAALLLPLLDRSDTAAPIAATQTNTVPPTRTILALAEAPSPSPTDLPPTPTNTPNPSDFPSTDTLTPTNPPPSATPEPSLSVVEIVATLDMQATSAARATDYAIQTITQAWIDSWTDTPTYTPTNTPNLTATIDTFLTHRAATSTQAWIDSWTDTPTLTATYTPTPTATYTPTPTPTPDPLEAALTAARTFSGSNADWEALYPDGFQHTFADSVTMVLVPAGCFMMGSTNGDSDEHPVNEQCFDDPFWIDLTEVTQSDFGRLGGEAASASSFTGDQRPVEQITWFEARDFCALRGARLPTEAEWEYAARGPDGLVYPWGNNWDENNAVWDGNSNGQTATVGSIPAGRAWVGAFDLSGNVWEWVNTIYGVDTNTDYDFADSGERRYSYPYTSGDGREVDNEDRTFVRVLRGGSWGNNNTGGLRSAIRNWVDPGYRLNLFGFRCARSR